MGGGKASRTLNSERASPTTSSRGRVKVVDRVPFSAATGKQSQLPSYNLFDLYDSVFFSSPVLSPEAPFYELPLFAPQERRAETFVEMEDENANLISKENEKIVRFDVFIFFVLFRPSSASSSLEVDCERLISRR